MELRYATIEDAKNLCRFARQTFYDTYAWYNNEQDMAAYLGEYFTLAKIKEDINNLHTTFLLALDKDALCGYIKLIWRNRPDVPGMHEKQLEIARLYTDKSFIGKGVGRQMMEACIDFAIKGNANIIWLDVWKENKRAVQFYTKWGFEIAVDWTFVLGTDKQEDYIMMKRFADS
jgi:ribosomal protein S18 acetylase RimI-like enzyme